MASLHSAITDGRVQQVRVLLGLTVDTKWIDKLGRTTMMKVAMMKSEEKAKIISSLLFCHEINYTALDCHTRTALSYAAMSGREYLVRKCIGDADFDIKKKDRYGHTCLMYAAMSGNPNCVRFLVQMYRSFGLTLDDRNPAGFTAYLLAVMYKNDSCAEILKDEGGASKHVCDAQRFWDDKAWAEIANLVLQSIDTALAEELGGNSKSTGAGFGKKRPHTAPATLPNFDHAKYELLRATKFVRSTTMNFNRVNFENPIEVWNENYQELSYKRRVVSSLSDYSTTQRIYSTRTRSRKQPSSISIFDLSDADIDLLSRGWANSHRTFMRFTEDVSIRHLKNNSNISVSNVNTHQKCFSSRPVRPKAILRTLSYPESCTNDSELQQRKMKTESKRTIEPQPNSTEANQKQELSVLFEQYSTVQLPVLKAFKMPETPRLLLTPPPPPPASMSRRGSRLLSISSMRKQRFSRSILASALEGISVSQ